MAQGVFTFLTALCQNVQHTGLPFQIVFFHKKLRHPVCTQFPKLKFIRHNFMKTWPWNLRRCRESDVMVNRLFSLIFSSNAHNKSSFTTGNQPLHRSSCTFLWPSLNSRTHLHTVELLMACYPYKSQSWRISASFMFFTIKKQITDHISHAAGFSIFLNIINTTRHVKNRSNACKLPLCLATESTNSPHTRTFMTAVLQWQY